LVSHEAVSPYFGSAQEIAERLQPELSCDPGSNDGFMRCTSDETAPVPQVEFTASGQSDQTLEVIVVRAADDLVELERWAGLALEFLPASKSRGLLGWVAAMLDADVGSGWVTRDLDGYSVTLSNLAHRPKLRLATATAPVVEVPWAMPWPGVSPWTSPSAPRPVSHDDAQRLAERFAPVLRFSKGERFFPVDVDRFVEDSEVCAVELLERDLRRPKQLGCVDARTGTHPKARTDCTGRRRCFVSLVPRLEHERELRSLSARLRLEGRLHPDSDTGFTVHWHVERTSEERVVVEYWILYSFNDFTNRHVGDWEWVGVEVEISDDSSDDSLFVHGAEKALYSSHHSGLWRTWPDVTMEDGLAGDHPVVYVAKGSHANYFIRGDYPVSECFGTKSPVCPDGGTDHAHGDLCELDTKRLLRPLPSDVFAGRYGPENYLKSNGLVVEPGPESPLAKKEYLDPQIKFAEADIDLTFDSTPQTRLRPCRTADAGTRG
jgi:hypothetical protein